MRRFHCDSGEFARRVPTAPYGFRMDVMDCPNVGLSGLLLMRNGELVCRLSLYEVDPCTVSPSVTRAMACSSAPRTRYFGPFVANVRLPRPPCGSKKLTWVLFQSS